MDEKWLTDNNSPLRFSSVWPQSMSQEKSGKLVIISGPSGVGKSTVVSKLIESCSLPLELSISATTRPVRGDDRPGENYIFLDDAEFKQRIENNEFLEYVEVFGVGHWYGTLRQQVAKGLSAGKWIVLEIDVEGAAKVMKNHPEVVSIFIHPGSIEELEKRLRGRGTNDEQSIAKRLAVAQDELDASTIYEHIVQNKTVDQTVNDICDILKKSAEQVVDGGEDKSSQQNSNLN